MREQWITADDGVRLHAARQGRGTALVLCHGGPGLWDYVAPLASMVDDVAEVWRYDQRGCGRSEGRDGPFTIERSVRDLDAVREAAGQERWIVGGHSWGATLGLLYAVAHPQRVRGLLYICGTGIEWSRWKLIHRRERDRRLAGSERFAELWRREDPSAEEQRELLALRLAADYADLRTGFAFAQEMLADHVVNRRCSVALNAEHDAIDAERWREGCRRLSAPVLIVEGGDDPRPREAVDSLAQALPNVERVLVRGAGHYPWLEATSVFQEAVRRWLEALI